MKTENSHQLSLLEEISWLQGRKTARKSLQFNEKSFKKGPNSSVHCMKLMEFDRLGQGKMRAFLKICFLGSLFL